MIPTKPFKEPKPFVLITANNDYFRKGDLISSDKCSIGKVLKVYKPRWWKKVLLVVFGIKVRTRGYKIKPLVTRL